MRTSMGYAQAPEPEPCQHRGNWDRSIINNLVLLMCGDCSYTLVLAEHLETGRLYWEEVPLEGDERLADVAEAVPEVQGDEGEQRVHDRAGAAGRSRRLVQVVQSGVAEDNTRPEEGQPSLTAPPYDYETLPTVSAGEVAE